MLNSMAQVGALSVNLRNLGKPPDFSKIGSGSGFLGLILVIKPVHIRISCGAVT
jgi:hypothetical protein